VKDDELRALLKANVEEMRRHLDQTAETLRREIRESAAETRREVTEDTRRLVDDSASETRRYVDAPGSETRRYVDEIRRHFDVRFEGVHARVDLVDEGIKNLSEQMNRRFAETHKKIDTGLRETQDAFRFGHRNHERRIAALERRVGTAKKK